MAEPEDWIRAHASVTGPIETTHERAWSTVRRVPTAEGTWWWKAPEGAHEAPLTALLASIAPHAVTPVVAIEPDRGWLLLRDAGTRLREILDRDPDLSHWERALRTVAGLQRAAAPHADEMLAMGVPDHRLERLPALIEDLLGRDEFLMLDEPEGLTRAQRDALVAQVPAIGAMCEELAAAGIAPSVQHDDLNDGNVYVDGEVYRIVDWGDACVSHPFHVLTVALRATSARLGLTPGGPEVTRLRDAYLEPFPGDRAELARVADLAYRTGTLARAYAWMTYVAPRPPEERGEDLGSVPYGLRKFLEDGPVGDWS